MITKEIINEELKTNKLLEDKIKELDSLILEEEKIAEVLKNIKNNLCI